MKVEVNIMKLGLTLKDITVGDKATIGEVSINMQYNSSELVENYALIRRIVKDIPAIVADLGEGAMAFQEMDKAFDGLVTTRYAEDATEESKQSAINKVLEVIKSLKANTCTCGGNCHHEEKEVI